MVKDVLMQAKTTVLDLIYPPKCAFCGEFYKEEQCGLCKETLPYTNNSYCAVCGKKPCICEKTTLYYDQVAVPFQYELLIKDAILRFKFSNRELYAETFAIHIMNKLEANILETVDYIVAVPMTRRDRNRRGYNQAESLAVALSKQIAKPCDFDLLHKVKKTKPQHTLDRSEREKNLLDAFSIDELERVKNKIFLLCDDILTTGTTLNQCARVLKEAGAKKVYGAVIATA